MYDYEKSRSTISPQEKAALLTVLNSKGKKKPKTSSMLGICAVTDDWRERHNHKPKVVFKITCSPMVGVK